MPAFFHCLALYCLCIHRTVIVSRGVTQSQAVWYYHHLSPGIISLKADCMTEATCAAFRNRWVYEWAFQHNGGRDVDWCCDSQRRTWLKIILKSRLCLPGGGGVKLLHLQGMNVFNETFSFLTASLPDDCFASLHNNPAYRFLLNALGSVAKCPFIAVDLNVPISEFMHFSSDSAQIWNKTSSTACLDEA